MNILYIIMSFTVPLSNYDKEKLLSKQQNDKKLRDERMIRELAIISAMSTIVEPIIEDDIVYNPMENESSPLLKKNL